jgi:hypothetical protein
LGRKFKSSKYYQYFSGLNSLPALNSNEIHHFWTDTKIKPGVILEMVLALRP